MKTTRHLHWNRWLFLTIVVTAFGVAMITGCSSSDSGGTPPKTTTNTVPEDLIAPYVTGTSPKLGIKGVSPSTILSAQLSEPAAPATITDQSMKVTDSSGNLILGTVSADASGVSINFTPSAPLAEGELYSAILSASITDLAGNAMAQPYAWSFEVSPPPPLPELMPPFVTLTNPAIGAAIAASDFSKPLTFTFSEALAPASVTAKTVHISDGTMTDVEGSITLDSNGTTATFTPSAPLKDSETYTVTLDAAITDVAANPMTYAYSYSFKTSADKTDAISAGTYFTLALKANGTVWAWGKNDNGQLGDGTNMERNYPVRVTGLTDIDAVSAGNNFGMALKADGTVMAWGNNDYGQLGDGTLISRPTPMIVKGLTDVKAIATGVTIAMALKNDGTVWSWGQGKGTGHDTVDSVLTPKIVVNPNTGEPLSSAIKIAAGSSYGLALVQNDPTDSTNTTLWAWGSNFYGILGNGTTLGGAKPAPVLAPDGQGPLQMVKDISASSYTAMALAQNGTLYTWGYNIYGNIGSANMPLRTFQKLPIAILSDVKTLQTGSTTIFTIAVIRTDDSVWGWGNNSNGQLGTILDGENQFQLVPMKIGTIWNVKSISTGQSHIAYLFMDGSVKTIGNNVLGQLGDGTGLKNLRPYHFDGLPPATAVSGMNRSSVDPNAGFYILTNDKTVWGIGSNEYCELALSKYAGLSTTISTPIQISSSVLTNVLQVSHGSNFGLARMSDGSILSWGGNALGQLGHGNVSDPVPAPQFECTPAFVRKADGTPLDKIIKISAGSDFSVALRNDNGVHSVWAWGHNKTGQLGQGTISNYSKYAVQITAFPPSTKIVDIVATRHALAVAESGELFSWGDNGYGELGTGATGYKHTPVAITLSNKSGVKSVASGTYFSLILLKDNTLMASGMNIGGMLGIESTASSIASFVPVLGISNVSMIAANGWSSYAVTSDKQLLVWGENTYGQMGQGNTALVRHPTTVPNPSGTGIIDQVVDISFASAVTASGDAWFMGVIPEGDLVYKTSPVLVVWP